MSDTRFFSLRRIVIFEIRWLFLNINTAAHGSLYVCLYVCVRLGEHWLLASDFIAHLKHFLAFVFFFFFCLERELLSIFYYHKNYIKQLKRKNKCVYIYHIKRSVKEALVQENYLFMLHFKSVYFQFRRDLEIEIQFYKTFGSFKVCLQ